MHACGPTGAAAGPHHQFVQGSLTDPAFTNPGNEIWLDLTTNAAGNGSATAVVDWQFPSDRRPASVIIHERHTSTGAGVAGVAGQRVACLTVPFQARAHPDPDPRPGRGDDRVGRPGHVPGAVDPAGRRRLVAACTRAVGHLLALAARVDPVVSSAGLSATWLVLALSGLAPGRDPLVVAGAVPQLLCLVLLAVSGAVLLRQARAPLLHGSPA